MATQLQSCCRAMTILTVVALTGCAGLNSVASSCLLPSQKPMTVVELFFGREISGRAPLSDAEWSDFAATVIAQQFPDGFTVYDGDGQWRDPTTREIVRERSKTLIVAADPSAELAGKLAAIADTYRKRFNQTSVGIVTSAACGAF